MNELVKAEKANNNVESLNQNNNMKEVKMTTAEIKLQAVDEARHSLEKAKRFLEENKDAEANIKKSAQVNVGKAEKTYLDALKQVELPVSKVEIWEESRNTEEQMVFTKRLERIIIARSIYNMGVSKVNVEIGEGLITHDKFERVPLYVTKADLFYEADIELRDLNGSTLPKGTLNVYVPVDHANSYWQWASYHEHNLNAMVKAGTELTIENVRIKGFASLQEFAQYRGVNNVLSRGFNSLEKAGNAALATQHEFFNKVYQKTMELKANISVVTKYYNLGKTLSQKVWNNAMLGVVEATVTEYDLNKGDEIITLLQDKKVSKDTIRHRYMIDAITMLANYAPNAGNDRIGIDGVLNTIKTLGEASIGVINKVTSDHVNIIYTEMVTQYLKNHGVIKDEQVA